MKEEAFEGFKDVLGFKIEIYGEVSSEMSVAYRGMAELYLEEECYDEAMDYYKRSLDIRAKIFGKSHPLTKEIMVDTKKLRMIRDRSNGK